MGTESSRFERVSHDFAQQIDKANMLVKVALEGLRRSGHVLDLTSQLRFAALNVFVKTERNHDNTNVFAPISREFMTLVRRYEELTREFGAQSSSFIELLMSYVKGLRRYQQVVLGICNVALAQCKGKVPEGELLQGLHAFFQEGTAGLVGIPAFSDAHFESFHVCYRAQSEELHALWERVRKGYRKLCRIDQELSTLSNLGEYAAQISKIEASRLEGREDLLAAFENISVLLNRCLDELQGMRSWFSQGMRIIESLKWEISGI